jgi:hypothetical protein
MGLENSRPVGLLEILHKASYAFDYAAITEVWERQGLLHNSQYAFRAKRGTDVLTRTAVITPFGVTEKIRRASGLPQGGTHSYALWNGFIDIMAEMQHDMSKRKGMLEEDEWGKEWELLTQLFADDAHHCASGTDCVMGLEERFEIATLWSAFFGMEHRATK